MALEGAYARNFFASAFDLPLVILEAESGLGKTTTLSYVADREGLSARWLTLEEDDADIGIFVQDLLQSIYHRTIPHELGLTTSRALELILGAICELSINVLILDNFETVAHSEQLTLLIQQLSQHIPPFTHLIIATNKPSNLRRGDRHRNRSTTITELDLRFDLEDVSQYFLKAYNYCLTPEEAAYIVDRTKGRPFLVNILGQLTRNLPSYLKIDWKKLPISAQPEAIKMLLREVISKLPRTLTRVTHEVASTKSLPDDDQSPVATLLGQLADRHCLVQQYGNNGLADFNVPHELLIRCAPFI